MNLRFSMMHKPLPFKTALMFNFFMIDSLLLECILSFRCVYEETAADVSFPFW